MNNSLYNNFLIKEIYQKNDHLARFLQISFFMSVIIRNQQKYDDGVY